MTFLLTGQRQQGAGDEDVGIGSEYIETLLE